MRLGYDRMPYRMLPDLTIGAAPRPTGHSQGRKGERSNPRSPGISPNSAEDLQRRRPVQSHTRERVAEARAVAEPRNKDETGEAASGLPLRLEMERIGPLTS
jgi:hypothetical protein